MQTHLRRLVIARGGQRKSYSENLPPQAFPQAQKTIMRRKRKCDVLKCIILIDSPLQTSLGYGTKPKFKTNQARYQISKQKTIDFR